LDDLQAYSHSLRLDLLLLDSELIAAHFGFTWDRRIYYYKPCLQIKYAKYSPGKILLEQIIQSAAKKEISEVDLLFGMEEYKLRYTSNIRKTGSLIICRSLLN
jgi:CelD/BcsL family acetyltransferase involved in cellulose biosynthesis